MPLSNKRTLSYVLGLFGVGVMVAILGVFFGYLGPSDAARPKEVAEIHIEEIRAIPQGDFVRVIGPDGIAFVFKPTPEILEELPLLDDSVFDPEIESYVEELGVFIYWGISTRFGCLLLHAPRGSLEHFPNWPGGFYDPCHDSSYDYAGRTLSDPNLSYARFVKEVSNLYVPEVSIHRDGMVRMRGNETEYDR